MDFFDTEDTPTKVKHHYKMGFIFVLDDDGQLDEKNWKEGFGID